MKLNSASEAVRLAGSAAMEGFVVVGYDLRSSLDNGHCQFYCCFAFCSRSLSCAWHLEIG